MNVRVVAVAAAVGELLGVRREVGVPAHGGGRMVGAVGVVRLDRRLLDAAVAGGGDRTLGLVRRTGAGVRARVGARVVGFGVVGRGGRSGLRLLLVAVAGLRNRLVEDGTVVGGGSGLGAEVGGGRPVGVDVGRDGLDVKIRDVDALYEGVGRGQDGVGHGESESSLHCDVWRGL